MIHTVKVLCVRVDFEDPTRIQYGRNLHNQAAAYRNFDFDFKPALENANNLHIHI